ncbi:LamG-like jellyroll fold domain-containing protein [Massilia sp. BKSP1R2A-1]|uniref:LamG-like jellyroll fold domain-containing protein n=1 Tax=Massilia sp. BKSP1R2A-1 TaxID=3422595 RepID=UPI003D358DC5
MGGMRMQPQRLVRLNRAHPLARELSFAWTASGPDMNLVSGSAATVSGTTAPEKLPYLDRLGRRFVAAGNLNFGNTPETHFGGLNNQTLFAEAFIPDTNVHEGYICGRTTSAFDYGLTISAGSQRVQYTTAGSNAGAVWPAGSVAGQLKPIQGRPVPICGTFERGATPSTKLYVDGIVGGTGTQTTSFQTGTNPFGIGARGGTGQTAANGIYVGIVLIFKRTLLEDEVASLSANPWQLFIEADDSDSVAPAAASSVAITPTVLLLGGGDVTMRVSRRVAVQAAQLQLAGANIGLRAARCVGVQPAALATTGGQVDLRAARRVAVSAADLVLQTGAAQLRATRCLPVTATEIVLQPGPVQLRAVRRLVVAPAVATLVGGSIEFVYTPSEEGNSYSIPVSPAALALTGGNVTMRVTRRIAAAPAALTLTTGDVRMLAARRLGVGAAVLQATASQILLRAARCLPVDAAHLVVAGGEVTLRYGSQVEYTRAPAGAGFSPQRVEVQARPLQPRGARPQERQRNRR